MMRIPSVWCVCLTLFIVTSILPINSWTTIRSSTAEWITYSSLPSFDCSSPSICSLRRSTLYYLHPQTPCCMDGPTKIIKSSSLSILQRYSLLLLTIDRVPFFNPCMTTWTLPKRSPPLSNFWNKQELWLSNSPFPHWILDYLRRFILIPFSRYWTLDSLLTIFLIPTPNLPRSHPRIPISPWLFLWMNLLNSEIQFVLLY